MDNNNVAITDDGVCMWVWPQSRLSCQLLDPDIGGRDEFCLQCWQYRGSRDAAAQPSGRSDPNREFHGPMIRTHNLTQYIIKPARDRGDSEVKALTKSHLRSPDNLQSILEHRSGWKAVVASLGTLSESESKWKDKKIIQFYYNK